jgi:hypothetical protein
MREHSISINEENTSRSVEFSFDNDGGCHYLTVKTFKTNNVGDLESTSVLIDREDAYAVIALLQAFTEECTLHKLKKKGA